MLRKIGVFCMVLGTVLVGLALALLLYNRSEEDRAGKAVNQILPMLQDSIAEQDSQSLNPTDTDMTVLEIGGYDYIGYLSIPALGLELPVMSEWDYSRLRIAPCRYSGSIKTHNLVIAAHNYRCQFGTISNLKEGDTITFTDIDGTVSCYTVALVEILQPTDVAKMISGKWNLTLFTCTYGGKTRVTVRAMLE